MQDLAENRYVIANMRVKLLNPGRELRKGTTSLTSSAHLNFARNGVHFNSSAARADVRT